MVIHVRQKLGVSERRACAVTGIARSSMRYQGAPRDDDRLRLELIRLAKQYGRLLLALPLRCLSAEGLPHDRRVAAHRGLACEPQEGGASVA